MAALSASQRYREKLKSDSVKWKLYLEKDRIRAKRNRKQQMAKLDKRTTAAEKRTARNKKRLYRENLKYKKENNVSMPYKCKQTKGKAIKRAKDALPKNPGKMKCVVKELYNIVFHDNSTKLKVNGSTKFEQHKKAVTNFFNRDEISQETAGKADAKSVKTPGNQREVLQKRYMNMTVAEAYQLYKQEFVDSGIGKSGFYSLRPQNVLCVADIPHNTCVCQRHANFDFLVSALKIISGFPRSYADLLSEVSCNTANESCMVGTCNECFTDIGDVIPVTFPYNLNIHWNQWERSDVNNRIQIKEHLTEARHVVSKLQEQLPAFKTHVFVKNIQSIYFKETKETLKADEAVLQIDFAENFGTMSQDEIQAAHWAYEQVTIFTACAWFKDDQKTSIIVVSDDLLHDKCSVWVFMKAVIDYVKQIQPQLKYISIFSDGCTSQFKNRYTMSSLLWYSLEHEISATWSFFATSHGKGAVDGIGGAAKRAVWTYVKARKAKVSSAADFAKCAEMRLNNIKVLTVTKDTVNRSRQELINKWENVRNIPNIQQKHYFEVADKNSLWVGRTAKSTKTKVTLFTKGKLVVDKKHARNGLIK